MTPFENLCDRIKLSVPGAGEVVATFSGRNDEGKVKNVRVIVNDSTKAIKPSKLPSSLRGEVDNFLYWLLDYELGDWHHDLGSKGHIIIDLSAEKVTINQEVWRPVMQPPREIRPDDWNG